MIFYSILLTHFIVSGYYVCPKCSKVYKHNSSLYNHRKYECDVDPNDEQRRPKFSCAICNKQFNRKFSYDRHVKWRHNQI